MRYVPVSEKWLLWDGRRWASDEFNEVMVLAKDTIRSLYRAAESVKDEDTHKNLIDHARKSERCERLRAMITLAQSEPGVAVSPTQLDADPMLLNCLNGTLDLSTGRLRLHDPGDLITKLAPVEYDPDACCPEWESFLARALGGDADLIEFMQRLAGYSLTGDAREEIFPLLYGPGQSGKTTFVETLKATMGEYASTVPFDTFLNLRGRLGPRNDIARLVGVRLVSATEAPAGQRFDESLMKTLTGRDTISARFLYREFFEFRPQFKIWLAANHRPRVRDDEDAFWRRVLPVPFAHKIPEEEKDPGLKERLQDTTRSRPGILSWAVRGCLAWQRDGLRVPKAVKTAAAEYREEMDTFGKFLEDRCMLGPGHWASSASLNLAYRDWCEAQGIDYPLSHKGVSERLRARGCKPEKQNGVRGWAGIGVLARGATADTSDVIDAGVQ